MMYIPSTVVAVTIEVGNQRYPMMHSAPQLLLVDISFFHYHDLSYKQQRNNGFEQIKLSIISYLFPIKQLKIVFPSNTIYMFFIYL